MTKSLLKRTKFIDKRSMRLIRENMKKKCVLLKNIKSDSLSMRTKSRIIYDLDLHVQMILFQENNLLDLKRDFSRILSKGQ